MLGNMTRGEKILAGAKLSRGNAISGTKRNLIVALDKSGHRPSVIARSLSISRTTVYYHLHPEKYQKKLDYMKRFRGGWIPEEDPWELEDG